jgi:heat shock protein 90kDa beta
MLAIGKSTLRHSRLLLHRIMKTTTTTAATTNMMAGRSLMTASSSGISHHTMMTQKPTRIMPLVAGHFQMDCRIASRRSSRPLCGMEGVRRVAASAAPPADGETFTYQAEVDRLMDMIVNSLYSNREVFLRELVSNASDALDKIRLLALQNPSEYDTGSELEIRIKATEDGTIVIEDTGVGMTKEELLSSLGTIARSGTAKFMEAMKEQGDANLIGQFGVGFYSAFLVADRVTVQTKSNNDSQQWCWESNAGSHSYTIKADEGNDIRRGTRITLHLKDDAKDIGDSTKLASLIKQYSEFISFPINLWSTKETPKEVVDDEATEKKQKEADEAAQKEGKESADPVAPVMKTEWETSQDWQVQNNNKPIWTRPSRDVTKEEYASFFKSTFREFLDPLDQIHFNVEGTIEFSSLLYIPGMAPFDQQESMQKSKNIRLYVKRVFISDEFDEDLMPRYLGFVKGVVDSADLPLNVSREILQESRVVRAIKRQLVKRTLDALTSMAERCASEENKVDDYTTFWEAFGRNIKLGVLEDEGNRQILAKLLRFSSSGSEGLTSLMDYVSRKKEGQTSIYFLAADSKAAAEASPYVEQLTSKGFEVLYLTEPIDEIAMANLGEFEGMQLVDVTKEDLSLGETEDDKKALEEMATSLQPLTEYMKKVLGDKIEKVTVTNRLTDTPAVVVASKFGWSANMERIMKAQALGDSQAAEYMKGRRSLEINPQHPIIKSLADKVTLESSELKDQISLLYDAALLTGGYPIESPKAFADRIYSIMQ